MTLTLTLDTSTVVEAALVADGAIIASGRVDDARAHAEELAPLVQRVLAQAGRTLAEVTAVVVGVGPGPFTGLRVGVATGATLAEVLGVPVTGACSLDAVAAEWAATGAPEEFLVVSDARRKEVYWARYAVGAGSVARLVGPAVDRPADLPQEVRALPTVGRGPVLFPDLFRDGDQAVLDVDAGVLVEVVARRLAAGEAMPVEALYLRRPDALTTAERAAR